jgi:hypothetical protein
MLAATRAGTSYTRGAAVTYCSPQQLGDMLQKHQDGHYFLSDK